MKPKKLLNKFFNRLKNSITQVFFVANLINSYNLDIYYFNKKKDFLNRCIKNEDVLTSKNLLKLFKSISSNRDYILKKKFAEVVLAKQIEDETKINKILSFIFNND